MMAILMIPGVGRVYADQIVFDVSGSVVNPKGTGNLTIYAQNNPKLGVAFDSNYSGYIAINSLVANSTIVMMNMMHVVSQLGGNLKYAKGLINNAPFTYNVTLTDEASGKSGTLTFHGNLDATIAMMPVPLPPVKGLPLPTALGFIPNITYTNPSHSIVLGGSTFTVGMEKPLSLPGGTVTYSMMASVTATLNSPEPSTLTIAGLGMAGMGFFTLRRRRLACPGIGQ